MAALERGDNADEGNHPKDKNTQPQNPIAQDNMDDEHSDLA